MKYIRTKDGIYEVDNENFDYVGKEYKRFTWNESQLVINQSDTIEELCDEFVYEKKLYKGLYELPYGAEDIKVFGAIWTDKGLIYVVKMNDRGELELLQN